MKMIRTACALALMISVSQLAWADTAPVQASLSVTNLNYTLTDLDQTDGVTPSLKPGLVTFIDGSAGTTTSLPSAFWLFANPKNNSSDYTSSISSGNLPGDIFDASAGSLTLPNGQGSASKLGNSQQADASLTSAVLLQSAPVSVYTQVKNASNFTLSAHSKLLITGDLVLTTQIDGSTGSALYGSSGGTLGLNLNSLR